LTETKKPQIPTPTSSSSQMGSIFSLPFSDEYNILQSVISTNLVLPSSLQHSNPSNVAITSHTQPYNKTPILPMSPQGSSPSSSPVSGFIFVALSKDHKLTTHQEIDRMAFHDGGFITTSTFSRLQAITNPAATANLSAANVAPRFCGQLAVSRSIGDFTTPHPMCSEPEIRILGGMYGKKKEEKILFFIILYIYMYVCICMYVYVCVCVCVCIYLDFLFFIFRFWRNRDWHLSAMFNSLITTDTPALPIPLTPQNFSYPIQYCLPVISSSTDIELAEAINLSSSSNPSICLAAPVISFDSNLDSTVPQSEMPPDIKSLRKPSSSLFPCEERDRFIVVACDGVWDVLTSEEVTAIVLDACTAEHWTVVVPKEPLVKDDSEVSDGDTYTDDDDGEEAKKKMAKQKKKKEKTKVKKEIEAKKEEVKRDAVTGGEIACRIRSIAQALGSKDNITVMVLKL
jgi:hypothetical protein